MSASTAYRCTPCPAPDPVRVQTGIIGIGNTLMGDDGAGIVALEKLQARLTNRRDLLFHPLLKDLFEMADLIDKACRFIFIDAFPGSPPGRRVRISNASPSFMPSLHQTDIGAVMRMLEPLRLADPFPSWEVRGIAAEPPFLLGQGLSGPVTQSVDELVDELYAALSPGPAVSNAP
jgi:hydrogenase maturation protease